MLCTPPRQRRCGPGKGFAEAHGRRRPCVGTAGASGLGAQGSCGVGAKACRLDSGAPAARSGRGRLFARVGDGRPIRRAHHAPRTPSPLSAATPAAQPWPPPRTTAHPSDTASARCTRAIFSQGPVLLVPLRPVHAAASPCSARGLLRSCLRQRDSCPVVQPIAS